MYLMEVLLMPVPSAGVRNLPCEALFLHIEGKDANDANGMSTRLNRAGC